MNSYLQPFQAVGVGSFLSSIDRANFLKLDNNCAAEGQADLAGGVGVAALGKREFAAARTGLTIDSLKRFSSHHWSQKLQLQARNAVVPYGRS